MNEPSLFSSFAHASFVVQFVMSLLVAASLASWTIIFQREFFLRKARKSTEQFEDRFWSGVTLTRLYQDLTAHAQSCIGLESIFLAGFKEFQRLGQRSQANVGDLMDAANRAMRIASAREVDKLYSQLSFLATVGSISPFVGLFGTVWGIIHALRALAHVQQASIAMVAPGIAEAMIATAMGLFAAIPAVIAYNRHLNNAERLYAQYETYQEEFTSILHRQALASAEHAS